MHEWDEYFSGAVDDQPVDDPNLDTLAAVPNGNIAVHMHCYRANEMAEMISATRLLWQWPS
jgi:hypothetical protein